MILVWTPRSLVNLAEIGEYVSRHNEKAAEILLARIRASTDLRAAFPGAGRSGRVSGTRDLVVAGTRYVAVYRLAPSFVEIVAVVHTSRRWPSAF